MGVVSERGFVLDDDSDDDVDDNVDHVSMLAEPSYQRNAHNSTQFSNRI